MNILHPAGLAWEEVSPKIDPDKLTSFIDDELGKRKNNVELVEYVSDDDSFSAADNTLPEFINHSLS